MGLRVAAAQIAVLNDDIPKNVGTLKRMIERAGEEGADILLTPEGALSGYTPFFDRKAARQGLDEITAHARRHHVGLALGTCFEEPEDGQCYNQLRFYDKQGKFLGFHSKTLNTGTLSDPPRGEIEHYAVRPLQTFQFEGVCVGGLVCNDLWANPGCTPQDDPHLSQQLSRLGAKVILHAVNGGRNGSPFSVEVVRKFHETQLQMRAVAGKVWIVTVDSCHPPSWPTSAPSGVVRPDGLWAVQAPERGESLIHFLIEGDL